MKARTLLVGLLAIGLLAACSSPERRAARAQQSAFEAQGNVANERLRLVDRYKDCVNEAGNDNLKIEACDSYLRAAEALK